MDPPQKTDQKVEHKKCSKCNSAPLKKRWCEYFMEVHQDINKCDCCDACAKKCFEKCLND